MASLNEIPDYSGYPRTAYFWKAHVRKCYGIRSQSSVYRFRARRTSTQRTAVLQVAHRVVLKAEPFDKPVYH